MLTKKERAAIAERFRNYDKAEYVTLYSGMYDGLLGEHVPKETTVKKDRMELASRILELCDTSNMLELPVDKDGEVICPGDTVYVNDDVKYEVAGYMMRGNSKDVILAVGAPPRYTTRCSNCGQLLDETSGIPHAPMFCPNCGARVIRCRLSTQSDQLEVQD